MACFGTAAPAVRGLPGDARLNPFVPAPDAAHIDTTDREPDEVFREALALVHERIGRER